MNTAYVAAHLYYERGLTQGEVAQRLGISRPTVSKLLAHAHQAGIVQTVVREPGERDAALEAGLVEAFGLNAAVVLPGPPESVQGREILLTQGASGLLKERLPKARRVGLGWGRSVLALVQAVEQGGGLWGVGCELVPLIGGSGQAREDFQINEIVRRMAAALGASARLLHAPALVEDERVRAALLGEPSVEPIVEAWRDLDVAIVGVGRAPEPAAGHLYVGEYLQDRTLASAAVGDVCSHYFGVDGRPLGSDRDAQLVAVSREQLERTPLVIGISSGREKIGAIVGAMRGRLINALVTDEATANGCLQIAKAA